MESNNFKRKRWNLLGFFATVIVTFVLLGLIIYGRAHKDHLEVVLSILTVFLVIAVFAVIRRNVKEICKTN